MVGSRKTNTVQTTILGEHPSPPDPFGVCIIAKDTKTKSGVQHRALAERDGLWAELVRSLRTVLVSHHTSAAALERTKTHREAMKRLGLDDEQVKLCRFPTNVTTQKGNLAEIVLAEYVVATSGLVLPVYRLRYNPNIDQSMKGDDVLAFDLYENPPRILVGEAKFRGVSKAIAVKEIVAGLLRSYKGGVPASLQFVADRLFEAGEVDLGTRVMECATLFAYGKLNIDYVGLLLSDTKAAERVEQATPDSLRRLVMISLQIEEPDSLVTACYENLE